MILKIPSKRKTDEKYRVNMVNIMYGKNGIEVNFSATRDPKGEQVELIRTYRNMVTNELEILNAALGMTKE